LLPDSEIIFNNPFRKIFSLLQAIFLFSLKQQDGGRSTVSVVVALIRVNKEPSKPAI